MVYAPLQTTTAPGVSSTQQMTDMLNMIMPLISLMLVFSLITPMMKGLGQSAR